ncbi:Response regulator protein VraR [Thermobacillus xylanilyticus]|jgi:NarL family two-component system response regulator LiaR|uniref:Response regulator containing a CheY-like receiver domain and an HTH DNA-binding domain n=2 Tax=Thermobacillus TaxID=76632 RepID=L0EG75_THECK|nr:MULTISPECIES: response regulator transcription factor [Thermobacillus]AGA58792.1 response regulator containing a CheY-like receiver domain and an HTH DNA-binding domain [Thermobacillus composti KWC4]REJ12478.1 MAG: DNA-binding response regulator [Paenibacillaceae bacterium]CAG5091832.1 Response regulator protein VraR [Thermobacillus xylanilyticus]
MGETAEYRIMIVDDHDMVRTGLKTYLMLEPKFEVCAEAGSGEEALKALETLEPDRLPHIILMDLMMPGMDGVETTRAVLARWPGIRIVMLTSFLEDDKVVAAVEAGATSYVLKTVSAEELIYALNGAVRGMPVMTSDVSQALTRGLRQRNAQEADEGLTEREKEVLLLIAEGRSNKEIADELHISIKTVKTHVSNLLMKCELEDRTQLAVYAHRKGLVKPAGR